MTGHDVLVAVIFTLFAIGGALIVYRIVRGPTILDRMIASDVLLTTTMLALGTIMALDHRSDLLPVLLVLAATSAFATIAVSRSVSKHDREEPGAGGADLPPDAFSAASDGPEAGRPGSDDTGRDS